ncbi:MAG: hypothetical protein A3B25_03685 [Candidatus Ryanbacteria bacterium RIFCSPLOWO2_01_FULL_48_26]|uniref:Uncharacterized protein n=1 Tax=Candidatus Ryanbacteria bacterium RIFCSPLOWO2_01_FULL_48_26 TaxID=1802126 RepID=A0A1G2GRP0_9BACT|nr:MAG: hypothetical protein A3B25_03685 [Candidatus Ryanbacteria bacterium RIFCSPLOWO2_01_FULL_48_26]
MNFKKWPYWVKGGATGFVLAILYIFLAFAGINIIPITCFDFSTTLEIKDNPPTICKVIFPSAYFDHTKITFVFGWFVYGSILGWLYGKINNKR